MVERFRELHPGSVITSAGRTVGHNRDVGGMPESKHLYLLLTPIAVDLDWPDEDHIQPAGDMARELEHDAKVLGLWAIYHRGHLHCQAVAPGELPAGYLG